METTKIEINHDASGNVTLTHKGATVDTVTIDKNTKLAIELGIGFTSRGSKVTGLTLYQEVNGAKGDLIGSWNRNTAGTQPSAELDIKAVEHHIVVQDTNTGSTDGAFFFGVTATDGTHDYSADPELKVKKTSG